MWPVQTSLLGYVQRSLPEEVEAPSQATQSCFTLCPQSIFLTSSTRSSLPRSLPTYRLFGRASQDVAMVIWTRWHFSPPQGYRPCPREVAVGVIRVPKTVRDAYKLKPFSCCCVSTAWIKWKMQPQSGLAFLPTVIRANIRPSCNKQDFARVCVTRGLAPELHCPACRHH